MSRYAQKISKPEPQTASAPPAIQVQTRPFAPPQVQQSPLPQSAESSQSQQDIESNNQQSSQPNLYAPNPSFSGNDSKGSTESVMQRKWAETVQRVKEGGSPDPSHTYTPMSGSAESVMQRKGLEIAQRLKETRAKQIQAKLAIGPVGDKYEQEADRVAAHVVQKINTPESVQREPEEDEELQMKPADINSLQREPEEEEELQMKPAISSIQRESEEEEELQAKSLVQRRDTYDGGEASADLESSIQSARGSGQSLDRNLQAKMGEAMGADFSGVKVHSDSQSDQLNKSIQAKAFTTGQDVFFRQGAYNPSSKDGQELIAHELTHVVQQTGSQVQKKSVPEIQTKIQKAPALKIQRDVSEEHFKELTYEGKLSRRGSTMKAIDALLKRYEEELISPVVGDTPSEREASSGSKASRKVGILRDVKELLEIYIEDHSDDKSRRTRHAGAIAFKQEVETEIGIQSRMLPLDVQNNPIISTANPKSKLGKTVNSVKDKHNGDVKSFFQKFAWMIDAAVPTKGDKSKLEIEFDIPVAADQSGVLRALVGGRLKAEAERSENDKVKVKTEIAVTGGVGIGDIMKIKGEMGLFAEAQAEDSQKLTRLISYAWYNRMCESRIVPREISNGIWGGSGGSVGFKRAEKFASKIEKDVFGATDEKEFDRLILESKTKLGEAKQKEEDAESEQDLVQQGVLTEEAKTLKEEAEKLKKDAEKLLPKSAKDAYIETGGFGGVDALLDLGAIKGRIRSDLYYGTRYDRESVKKRKKSGLGETRALPKRRGRDKTIGRTTITSETTLEVNVGAFKGQIKIKYNALEDVSDKSKTQDTAEIELSAQANFPQGMPMSELAAAIIGAVDGGVKVYRTYQTAKANKKKFGKSQGVGSGAVILTDLGMAIGGSLQTGLAGALPKSSAAEYFGKVPSIDVGIAKFTNTVGLKLTYKYSNKPDGATEHTLALDSAKAIGMGIKSGFSVSAKQESTSRLVRLKYSAKPGAKGTWLLE